MKTIDEINTRSAEIAEELKKEGADLAAFETELNELRSAKETICKRNEMLGKASELREVVAPAADESRDLKDMKALRSKETIKLELNKRAILVGNGNIATPTQVSGINSAFNEVSSIVDLVKITDASGMGAYKVGYEKTVGVAGITGEGVAAHSNDPEFDHAIITPVKITTYTEVSREVTKLTPLNYMAKIKEAAYSALRRKVAQLIVAGDPTATPDEEITGILNAPITTTLSLTAIDEKTLRRIAMNYGGSENIVGNAILQLNKDDLIAFGDIRGTSNKNPVYEITPDASNPNTGIIKDGGLAVKYVINSKLKSVQTATAGDKTMIYGVPMCYELGLFAEYEIRTSEDSKFKEGLIAVLGEAIIGGNVVVDQGFVVVAKG